ncbi:RDD family protein [Azotosporobacter soli]|uniref:RDD family protein n=1 Tax=Azotosporobacter soli TaxID=3055040 RepID=UPI0031FF3788
MKCPSCQIEVPMESKFCQACGARMEATLNTTSCPLCGERMTQEAKFCSACGALKDAPQPGPPPLKVFAGRPDFHGKGVGVGMRAVATVLDLMILFALSFVLAIFSGGSSATGFSLEGGPFFLMSFTGFAYYTFFEWKLAGTPGKLALGLQVVKVDGTACDLQAALIRTVSRIADGLFFYLVAAVAVWSSESNQRLGDRIAGTLVVRREVRQTWKQMKDEAFNSDDE